MVEFLNVPIQRQTMCFCFPIVFRNAPIGSSSKISSSQGFTSRSLKNLPTKFLTGNRRTSSSLCLEASCLAVLQGVYLLPEERVVVLESFIGMEVLDIDRCVTQLGSGDSWMYPYQRTPMGNPYISPISTMGTLLGVHPIVP